MEKKIAFEKISPVMLLDVHARMQKGTYFSEITLMPFRGLKFAHSKLIEDYYWNYAYGIGLSNNDLQQIINQLKAFAKSINRTPVLYISKKDISNDFIEKFNSDELEEEVWMVKKLGNSDDNSENNSLSFKLLVNDTPSKAFINVFKNAYCEGTPGTVGYSELPGEYVKSLENSKSDSDIGIVHIIGEEDGVAVTIATLFIADNFAGLYNVATIPTKRRKNYGTEISKKAIEIARSKNCNYLFLQTKADSEVEELYKKIGFERNFIGVFLKV